jgi:hypothetical protein
LQKSQSVATPAVLAILQVQQGAGAAIFSSGAPLDLLAIRPFHNSKRHFPNGNRRQTPPCLPKSETDGRTNGGNAEHYKPVMQNLVNVRVLYAPIHNIGHKRGLQKIRRRFQR